jgi:fibronectin-binding autotransporter adhesin
MVFRVPSRLRKSRISRVTASVFSRHMVTRVIMATGVFGVLIGSALTLFVSTPVSAGSGNSEISFQGKLVNSDGTNVPNGNYNIEFKMYTNGNGLVAGDTGGTGGALQWTEDWLNYNSSQGVTVTNGIFQVNLGSITSLPAIFSNSVIWLSINLGTTSTTCTTFSGCGGDGEMTPMIQMTASPYAVNSNLLGGISAAGFAQLNPGSAQTGSLNIGTTVQAGVSLQAPLLDTATAVGLGIGTTTASSVTLGHSTVPYYLQGNSSSTFSATSGSYTTTVGFTTPTANNGITFPNAGGVLCTNVASTCNTTYQAYSANGYLAKNAADTSTATGTTVTAGNYLYGFTNNSTTAAGGVLSLSNGANTGNSLYVTASGNPSTTSNALIVANNAATTPSGNLVDLQKNGTNEFTVDYNGNLTQSTGTTTTDTINGQTISAAANFTGTVTATSSVISPLHQTADVASGNSAQITVRSGNVTAGSGTSGNVVVDSGSSTGTYTGNVNVGTTNADNINVGRNGTGAPGVSIDGAAGTSGNVLQLLASAGGNTTTLNFTAPTTPNVITFPNAGGTVCTNTATTCASSYIVNSASLQSGSNFNISGTGAIGSTLTVTGAVNGQTISSAASFTGTVTAATSVLAPLFDTATAVGLNVGTGVASSVTIGRTSSTTPVNIQGSSGSTWVATGSAGTTTLAFAAPTATATVLTLPTGTGTICTTVATTCGSTYQTTSVSGSYLAKNATDTSLASVAASSYLYSFTNSGTALSGGVLNLANGSNTGDGLYVTASGTPAAGSALIVANNTAGTGNLIDLQSNGTSEFNVSTTGTATVNGNETFTSGSAHTIGVATPGSGNTTGSALAMSAATGLGTGSGGALTLQGGASGSGASGAGGAVNITAGSALSTSGAGGSIVLTAGTSTNGATNGGVSIPYVTGAYSGSTNAFQVFGSTTVFNVDTNGNHVEVGNCSSGKLCVNQQISGSGASGTNVINSSTVTSTGTAGTDIGQKITIADTSGIANNIQGMVVDTTSSTNTSALITGILINTPTANTNSYGLDMQGGGVNNFTVSNTGAVVANGSAIASVAGAGVSAPTELSVTGTTGGATSGSGTVGGTGGGISVQAGAGGASGSGASTGGAGGALTFASGAGGTPATAGAGGVGGNISFTAANGGNATGANANGNGGSITLAAGSAGTGGSGGSNGAINLNAPTIATNAATIALLNSTATTVNAFGAASAINLGASGTSVAFGNGGAATLSATGTLTVTSAAAAAATSNVLFESGNSTTSGSSGTVIVQSGSVVAGTAGTVSLDTGSGSSTGSPTVNLGAANATAVNIGTGTGGHAVTTTIGSSTTAANSLVLESGSTGSIAIGNAATAHTIAIGTSSSAIQGVSLGSSFSSSVTTLTAGSGNINLNAATIATNATSLTAFNTNAATVNAFGAATAINLGASADTVTLGNTGGTATLRTTAGALTVTSAAAATWSTGAGALTVDSAANLNLGTSAASGVTIGKSTTTTNILGTTQLGSVAGTGSLLNNGSTVNTVDALTNFGSSSAIGTAPATVDIYTYISIAQSTTGVTLTIPTPTASTTYGRVVYITNSGSVPFTMLSDTTNPGSTATLVWVNKNGTGGWSFAGADGSGILNQNTLAQAAGFWINGSGEASTNILTPALDVISAGVLDVGNATATTVQVGSNGANNPIINLDSGTSNINIGTGAQARTINVGTGVGVVQTINIGGTGSNVIGVGNVQAAGSVAIGTALTSGSVTVGGTSGSAATTLQAGSGGINLSAATTTIGTSGNSLLENEAATNNAVCAYTGVSGAFAFGTAGKTVNTCTNFDITDTGATTATPPIPTAGAGSIIYVSNMSASTAAISLVGITTNNLNVGSTATLVYNGSAWTFAGADAGNLQSDYNGSGTTSPQIGLSTTNKGLYIADASGGIGSTLFGVGPSGYSNSTGTGYLAVTSTATTLSGNLDFVTGATGVVQVNGQTTAATAGNNLQVIAAAGNTSGVGGNLTLNGGAGGNAAAGGTASLIGGASGGGATAGGAVTVQGGLSNATAGSNGGAASLLGGAGTSTGTGGVGGLVAITAGSSFGTAANVGGTVAVTGGQGSPSAAGGAVTVQGGAGGTTSGNGGLVTIQGGTATLAAASVGGGVAITGGTAAPTAGSLGGIVTINGGAGTATGTGAAGNAVNVNGGAAGGTGNNAGGAVKVTGGAATGTGTGGLLTLQGGAAGPTTNGTGGGLLLQGGNGSSASAGGAGGAINLNAGDATGTGNNNGGNIILSPGNAANSGVAGVVDVTAGTNSASTFQVQNSVGASVLNADTKDNNGCVQIGEGAGSCSADTNGDGTLIVDSGTNYYSGLQFTNLNSNDINTTNTTVYGQLLGIDANGNVGLSNAAVSLTSPALAYWDGLNNPTTGSQSYPTATLSGSATYVGGGNGVQLTPVADNDSGSINWSFAQVPFEETQFQFKAGGGNGADSTWFYSYANAIPTTEFGTGLTQGYLIYFSEYHGCAGIAWGSYTDGNQCNSGGGANPLTSTHLGDINDNNFHDVDIQLLYNQIIVRWDGAIILDYNDKYTRNTSDQDFGFGSRTGGSDDAHYIKGLLVTKLGTNTSQYDIDTTSPLAPDLNWSDPADTAGAGSLGVNTAAPSANLEVDGTTALEGSAYTTTGMTACQMVSNTCATTGSPPADTASVDVWGTGTTFTSSMVGDKIVFSNGDTDTIASYISATEVTVGTSRIVAPGTFQLFYQNSLTINSSGNVVSGSNNTVFQPNTDSATAFTVEQSSTDGSNAVMTVDSSTTNAADGVLKIGSNSATSTQKTLLQLDSYDSYADTGTISCTTTTNQGAMYYNNNTNDIRGCVNGSWEDIVTTSGLGIILYGVVPDSPATTGTGDLAGADGYNSGPCKAYLSATATVSWNSCLAYSNGRKVSVTAGSQAVSATANVYENLCLSTTTGQPAFLGTSATQTTATQPAWAVGGPVLCLATVYTGNGGSTVASIYDTRVYTTDTKSFATLPTAAALGIMVYNNGTIGQDAPTTATTQPIVGVVGAYSGTTSTTTPNAVIITNGPIAIESSAGTIGQVIESNAGATPGGVGLTTAITSSAETNAYTWAGIAQNAYSGVAGTTHCTAAAVCNGSLFTNLNIR